MHTPFSAGPNSRHQGGTPFVSGNDSALSTQALLAYKTTHRCWIATHGQILSEMTWLRGTELFGGFGRCSPSLLTKESSREERRVLKNGIFLLITQSLDFETVDQRFLFVLSRGRDEGMQGIESVGLVPSLHNENERIISILSLTSAVPKVETTGHPQAFEYRTIEFKIHSYICLPGPISRETLQQ